jgi:fatty-acyl-CoA synthase
MESTSPVRSGAADPVFDWLAYWSEFDPDRLAAIDLATGRRFTYEVLNDRATRLATALAERHGVGVGDRVAFLAHNSTDHFETLFACWKLGAICVPLNWRLASPELLRVVRHCAPAVVIHDEPLVRLLGDDGTPRISRGPLADAVPSATREAESEYESLIASHAPRARRPDSTFDTVAMLIYTSGTTGRPKGVIYTHRMVHNIVMHAALHARVRAYSRTLTYSPLFHSAGLCALTMPQFHYGGVVAVMRRWDPAEALACLCDPELAITHTVGVPTTYQQLAELPEFASATFPALELCGVGGAPVPRHLLDEWRRKNVLLSQSYGMTEAFSVSFCPPEKYELQTGSAGHALMHVGVRIGDADGRELPRGSVGEVQVRGPGVTPGYWNDPDATAAAFTADGWFRSGDAAWMTPDGTIYVVDRIKDMYISGGENVYPAEIEDVIDSFDEVSQSAVVGTPDARWGEVGLALVQLRPGAMLAADEVLARCRERLARYKVPQRVEFVTSLPLSAQGKVLKHELRARYAAGTELRTAS